MHDVAFRFTTGELATFIPAGTLLGAVVGAVGSYFGITKAAKHAARAQAGLAERAHQLAREDAAIDREAARRDIAADRAVTRRDQIEREVRAHKRDAYLQLITLATTLRSSFIPVDYMHACPELKEGVGSDDDIAPYRAWFDQRIHMLARAAALATAYGSDSMASTVRSCDHDLGILLTRLQGDMYEAMDDYLDGKRPAGGRAFGRALHQWFGDAVQPVRDGADRIIGEARRELHLTSEEATDRTVAT